MECKGGRGRGGGQRGVMRWRDGLERGEETGKERARGGDRDGASERGRERGEKALTRENEGRIWQESKKYSPWWYLIGQVFVLSAFVQRVCVHELHTTPQQTCSTSHTSLRGNNTY